MQTPNYMTVVSEANASTHNASTSFGKTFFAWCFTLNGKNALWLTISYQKPFVVSVPALCFQILIWPKMGLTYAISIVKWIFGFFFFFLLLLLLYIFCFSLLILNHWCSITILWKFQKFWTSGKCWKVASKLHTLSIFAYFAAIFTMGKKERKYSIFFLNQWLEKNCIGSYIGSYNKWFWI